MITEWVTAIATSALAVAALWQLPLIAGQVRALAEQLRLSREADQNAERRQREWETLRACERYDCDPVLEEVTRRIHTASEGGRNYANPAVQKRDVVCLLNYLDGLATGIQQGLYIDELVKDHLHLIFEKAVRTFIDSGLVEKQGYEKLLAQYARWSQAKSDTEYRSGRQ